VSFSRARSLSLARFDYKTDTAGEDPRQLSNLPAVIYYESRANKSGEERRKKNSRKSKSWHNKKTKSWHLETVMSECAHWVLIEAIWIPLFWSIFFLGIESFCVMGQALSVCYEELLERADSYLQVYSGP